MGRKIAREDTMKLLFQMDITEDYSEEKIKKYLEENSHNPEEDSYIYEASSYIVTNKDDIDNKIEKYARGWKTKRFAKVDLAVLRIAIYEIVNRDDIPIEVSINEALEISKKYSTGESSKFINGILGSLVRGMNK
ncbi:transcription antitermination factor NusB [Sporosalibacterium faouarense]|uniref:transcription antitermination factor NusB n=1 Tax=Sporosalibacterium faouarense TaxID=516123 RepID=UPI00141CC4A6|nr:transcription antitermination factor NusB [Sporosalibacterium faouarense]MTI48195.1 transcription antitermination factor NusB [Bacillota bacterium]